MNPLTAAWRRVGARVGAWAAARLDPHDRADAVELDRRLRRHSWRWLGLFALGAAAAALVMRGIRPTLAWDEAFLYGGVACLWLLLLVAPPWFGYRRFGRQPALIFTAVVVLAMLGAAAGFAAATFKPGMSWADVPVERLTRAAAIAFLCALAMASLVLGISRMRLREAAQRNARLEAEAERERLARQNAQAELRLLQAQVEPHFLFNTLANVRHLVQSGSRDAVPMLDHLIDYLRTALPDLRSEATTLGREAELARAYLEIMRMRMGGELRFAVEIAPEVRAHRFPPLMLMTLVENAVKHGIAPVGRGEVRIVATRRGERLVVAVADDGRGLGGAIGQGVGLANVRERLRALHGAQAALTLESGPCGGTVARLELPA